MPDPELRRAIPQAVPAGYDLLPELNPPEVPTLPASKRIFDQCFAVAALLALMPVMFLIALAILLIDRQNPFFGHLRVGNDDSTFRCWKFRTMARNAEQMLPGILATNPVARAEWMATQKLSNDPRITRVGAFLRKTSLDELPQFWNVLRGEMSVVGPRPIVLGEISKYGERYWAYRMMRPGITGLWQVTGRSTTSYDERVAMDVAYARARSFWWDIAIVFRTVRVVLFRVGAV